MSKYFGIWEGGGGRQKEEEEEGERTWNPAAPYPVIKAAGGP